MRKDRKHAKKTQAAVLAAALLTAMPMTAQQSLHELFLNPPAEARPMMRWWWFGPAVEKSELKKELETMRAAGIGGVEIQPVYPMSVDDTGKGIRNLPYLSQEFLDDVRYANETARSLGLRVDITLGSGWPYGGPKTTVALSAGRLRVVETAVHNGVADLPRLAEGDSIVAGFAVKGSLKDFDPATAHRIDAVSGKLPEDAIKEAQSAIFFLSSHTRQQVKRPSYGAEGLVLDHFSRAAIEEHLKDVAEPLMKAFGDKPPYAVFSDSLEVYGSDWTADFAAEFQKRRGYDIVPYLPQLLHGGSAEAASVRHDWGRTLAELVRENYLTPVTRFAEAHQTRFRSQTYGEPAVTLADEATPALPEGEGPQWRDFSFTRWATSASHIYGRTVTSAETWTWLHSPAFRATPLDMKAEADRMFLLGVNQIVGHGYPYSPESAGEPGWSLYAAAAFNAHNPWFPVMPEVTLYLQRLSWLLRQGSPANDVAVLLPEDDAQAAFTPGHVSVTVEMKQRISSALMGKILDTGYNIDYIDVASILKTGGVHYPVLVLPSVERIPLSAYRAIAAYAAAGGKVIALGTTPSLAPGLREAKESSEIVALSEKLFRAEGHPGVLAASEAALPDVLRKSLVPDLLVQGNAEGLGFLHRHLDESDIYFLANTSNHPIEAMVHPRAMRKSYAMWSPDNGAVLAKGADDVNSRIALELAPYESRVLVLSEENGKAVAEKVVPEPDKTKELSDLSQGWQLCFTKGGSAQSVDLPKSWTEIKDRNFYSGEGVYTRTFTLKADQGSGRRVWLDFGEGTPTVDPRPASAPGIHALIEGPVREAAIVEINGVRAGALWHAPWRVEVSGLLHAGENQIVVHVYNTAINHLAAGPKRDFGDLNAKFGKRFEMQDMDNLQALPSGLLGPVKLVEERE